MTDSTHPYDRLTPDLILDAVESVGLRADGRQLALNSYENRVYQIWLEDDTRIIAKFYRPGRWTNDQILEEHTFTQALAAREIPVFAPQVFSGQTLHTFADFRFSLTAYAIGRAPEFEQPQTLEWMGRFLGRIHAVGAQSAFHHRHALTPQSYGHDALALIAQGNFVPQALRPAYAAVTRQALDGVAQAYARTPALRSIRVHGDCHGGNVLWNEGPQFVDFDDCCTAPALQDLWMLLSGSREEQQAQLGAVIDGYEDFMEFDRRELNLLEALRTLRLIHMSGWIAKRWSDPAFPRAFPWFGTERYWQDRILELREQIALMSEPPLVV
jgi:Ser/Thr protein kinase RdoA (MazF antagonist)